MPRRGKKEGAKENPLLQKSLAFIICLVAISCPLPEDSELGRVEPVKLEYHIESPWS